MYRHLYICTYLSLSLSLSVSLPIYIHIYMYKHMIDVQWCRYVMMCCALVIFVLLWYDYGLLYFDYLIAPGSCACFLQPWPLLRIWIRGIVRACSKVLGTWAKTATTNTTKLYTRWNDENNFILICYPSRTEFLCWVGLGPTLRCRRQFEFCDVDTCFDFCFCSAEVCVEYWRSDA